MDRRLISKVLSGDADDRERREVNNWAQSTALNQAEFNNLSLLHTFRKLASVNAGRAGQPDARSALDTIVGDKINKTTMRILSKWFALMLCLPAVYALVTVLPESPSRNIFQFENTTLSSAVEAIEERYQVTISIDDDAAHACTVSGTFYGFDNPEDLVQSFALSLSCEYQKVNANQYRLTGLTCPPKS